MSRHLLFPLCLLLALRLASACADEPVGEQLLGPRQGVLLLRNGELIEGKVTLAGDRYDVVLDDGEISIKRTEVELFCRNAEQCYEQKRSHVDPDKVEDHLELAEWCLRHDLKAQAKRELEQSQAIDPTHPKIALFQRRLTLADEEASAVAPAAAQVRQPTPAKQLERMLREMPSGAVETFNTTIQPLLTSQCSTSGCHGPQAAGALRLLRASGRPLTHRAMLLNLSSVLAVIDRDNPSASPLLTAPAGPHGTCKAAIFSQRDAARVRALTSWVSRVSNVAGSDAPATLEGSTNPQPPSGHSSKHGMTQRERLAEQREKLAELKAQNKHSTRLAATTAAADTNAVPSAATTAAPEKLQLPTPSASPDAQSPASFVPKDAFDPEIFNRRKSNATR